MGVKRTFGRATLRDSYSAIRRRTTPQVPSKARSPYTGLLNGTRDHGLQPADREYVIAVYRRAVAALEIHQEEIRRDFLTGVWLEAVNDFRSGAHSSAGMAEADAERCADRLVTEILEIMERGAEWLRERIRLVESTT